jgi:ABC-type lipoprotein export system ATPase subunit
MTLLKNLNESGLTIIMVTHNQGLSRYTSRTVNVKDGEC